MMSLQIETDLDVDAATLTSMVNALPPSWQARVNRYKPLHARIRSAIGYTLLARILREQFHLTVLPTMEADEHGKPFFTDCPLRFSISHCKAAVACAVASHPIGLDVQDILADVSPTLAARIAAPLDPAPMDARALTVRWTQKEASAKLDGRGLAIGLEHLPLPNHTLTLQDHQNFILSFAKD